jgi:hypothetical protein
MGFGAAARMTIQAILNGVSLSRMILEERQAGG